MNNPGEPIWVRLDRGIWKDDDKIFALITMLIITEEIKSKKLFLAAQQELEKHTNNSKEEIAREVQKILKRRF